MEDKEKIEKNELLKNHVKLTTSLKKLKNKILESEQKILKIYSLEDDEKSKTFKNESFKTTITGGYSISFLKEDHEKYIEIRNSIPPAWRPEKVSYAPDEKGYNYMKTYRGEGEDKVKEIFNKVQPLITIKLKKISVKVEKI